MPAIKAVVEEEQAKLAKKLSLETEELVATAKAVVEADPIEFSTPLANSSR